MKIILSRHFILDIQTISRLAACLKLQKPQCKTFRWKYIKNESQHFYLGVKEQKAIFPNGFCPGMHFSFAHRSREIKFVQTRKIFSAVTYLIYQDVFPKLTDNIAAQIPVRIYLLKANKRNARTRCEICSKLTIKTPERRQWRCSGVFIVTFEHISHLVLVFLLLTLSR